MQIGPHKSCLLAVLLCGVTIAPVSTTAAPRKGKQQQQQAPAPADKAAMTPVSLSLRNQALTTLWEIRATKPQLQALKKLANECADDHPRIPGQVGPKLRQTMEGLHDALVEAKDEDLIAGLQDQYDRETDARNIDLDDEVKLTQPAKQHAPDVLKMLSVRQLASFITYNEDLLVDPREELEDLVRKMKTIPPDKWEAERDSVADDAGMLLAGLHDAKVKEVSDRVRQWLDKAHQLDDQAFTKKLPDLVADIPNVVGEVDSVQAIQHWARREIATLLSNSELTNAIDERLK